MQGVRQERDVFRAAFARRSLQTDCYAICNTVCAGISRKVVSRVGLEPTTRCLRGTTFFSHISVLGFGFRCFQHFGDSAFRSKLIETLLDRSFERSGVPYAKCLHFVSHAAGRLHRARANNSDQFATFLFSSSHGSRIFAAVAAP